MHPEEEYSGDLTPAVPWTPLVWRIGPDGVIAQAKAWLEANRASVFEGLAGGDSIPAMSGDAQSADEAERMIDPNSPPEGQKIGRAALWNNNLKYLRATNLLSASGARPLNWEPPPKKVNPELEG